MEVFNREIERKYTVQGVTYEQAYTYLSTLARVTLDTTTSFDLYWPSTKVDFVRLRDNSKELTIKLTDKGSILDRVEENVRVVEEDMPAARRLLGLLLGQPTKLTKRFSVFKGSVSPAPGTLFQVIYCLYQVDNDPEERLFFEIEAESMVVVDYARTQLGDAFSEAISQESRSLYQIFQGVL